MQLKNIVIGVIYCFIISKVALAAEFNNKFSSWWSWKHKTRVGKIQKVLQSKDNPQGTLFFLPVPGKYSIQAYVHIKIDNTKCYKVTLKLKTSPDIDSNAKMIFFLAAKDKKKSWQKLTPALRKEVQLKPGESQTVSIVADLPAMASENIAFLIPTVAVIGLQKGKIKLENLVCECIKAPVVKNQQETPLKVALMPGYRRERTAMPKNKWPGGGGGMRKIFDHIPLNVSVLKLNDKIQKALGFQWPDGRILLIKRQGNFWIVLKGKADSLQECIKLKVEKPELVFYGTGILLHKNGKMLFAEDYGINNLNVHPFFSSDCGGVKFKNVNILEPFLQWRYLDFTEKNLRESKKIFKNNQKYIISAYRGKKNMAGNWKTNFVTLRNEIAAKRKEIISETGTFLPLLEQISNVHDGYSTIIQYAGLMSIKHSYLGTYFQKNWFKNFGGMAVYQYSIDLKKRCSRLAARARRLGNVAFKEGIAIKQNNSNVLAAGFTDSLSTVFKNRSFLGRYNKSFLLKLCKGEYESCQLILRTGDQDVKDISIEIGDISGPGSVSKEQCRFYLQRYVRLAEPYDISVPVTGGGNTYWPDPLRQWENNKEFSIPSQSNQVIWLTLKAPENAVAGEYKFDVKVKLKSLVVAQLPVKFRIYDFVLGKNRLMNASGLRFGSINKFYQNNAEARKNCEKILLEHYCNPIDIYNKSPNYEDVKNCIKNGMAMVALDRFETLAAPRKGMVDFVQLYVSNDGKKFEQVPAEVKLVPQTGDIDIVDWNLVVKPESNLKDYKYIKVHNSETRGWRNRCGRRFFLINSLKDGVLLNGEDKINKVKYYMLDKFPAVAGGARLIEKPRYFEFDDVRLNKGRASIIIEKAPDLAVNEICLVSCKRSIYIASMKKAYKKFREIVGEKFPIMSFGFDEVGKQENPEVLSALKACKKLFPEVITVTTAIGIKKMPECYKYLDYMCPSNCRFFNNMEEELFKKYGTQGWIYTGGGGYYPYPNFERLDQSRINSRAFFWVCARYNLKGWLYWSINMWRYNTQLEKKWPEIWDKWDGSWSFTNNGMGALLYPGPNNTAMPSTRLEAMRDGIEDYNYLKIAEEMLKTRKFDNTEQYKEISGFIEKAKYILSPGFSGFLENFDKFDKLRDKLASYIEKMNKLPIK